MTARRVEIICTDVENEKNSCEEILQKPSGSWARQYDRNGWNGTGWQFFMSRSPLVVVVVVWVDQMDE